MHGKLFITQSENGQMVFSVTSFKDGVAVLTRKFNHPLDTSGDEMDFLVESEEKLNTIEYQEITN